MARLPLEVFLRTCVEYPFYLLCHATASARLNR
jgi:hypothetical protein